MVVGLAGPYHPRRRCMVRIGATTGSGRSYFLTIRLHRYRGLGTDDGRRAAGVPPHGRNALSRQTRGNPNRGGGPDGGDGGDGLRRSGHLTATDRLGVTYKQIYICGDNILMCSMNERITFVAPVTTGLHSRQVRFCLGKNPRCEAPGR